MLRMTDPAACKTKFERDVLITLSIPVVRKLSFIMACIITIYV